MKTFSSDVEAVDALRQTYAELRAEIGKVIVGQDQVVQDSLISIFCNGHCLLVGVPGLAKTLLVNTIASVLGLSYNRIQFTPDLMPSDIIGTEILDENRQFKFIKGPLFANIILADEPTGNLDQDNAQEVFQLLLEQVNASGAALLLVTHDIKLAKRAKCCFSLTDGSLKLLK